MANAIADISVFMFGTFRLRLAEGGASRVNEPAWPRPLQRDGGVRGPMRIGKRPKPLKE
jgi:hypothetical protein